MNAVTKSIMTTGDVPKPPPNHDFSDFSFFENIVTRHLRSFTCNRCLTKCCVDCKLRIAKFNERVDLENTRGSVKIVIRCPGCRNRVTEKLNPGLFGYYKNCMLKTCTFDERAKWTQIIMRALMADHNL